MNTFLKYFMALLPTIIKGVATLPAKGADKKEMVKESLLIVAEGVAAAAPQHGEAATVAAQTAVNAIDGVYAVLKATGAVSHTEPVAVQ